MDPPLERAGHRGSVSSGERESSPLHPHICQVDSEGFLEFNVVDQLDEHVEVIEYFSIVSNKADTVLEILSALEFFCANNAPYGKFARLDYIRQILIEFFDGALVDGDDNKISDLVFSTVFEREPGGAHIPGKTDRGIRIFCGTNRDNLSCHQAINPDELAPVKSRNRVSFSCDQFLIP